MPAGRWGSDSGDDLEHEVAVAAALDRSRTDLNPDAETSARMKADFFARLAQEWGAPAAPTAPPESDLERTTRIAPVPAEDELPAALAAALAEREANLTETRDLGAPAPAAEDTVVTADETRSADAPDNLVSLTGRRRARHTLPANHPDNARRPSRKRRVVLVGAAASVGLVALLGGIATVSQGALPGDPLYAMKLMSESTGSAFTFGDAAKAQRELDIAATRLQEIRRLQEAGRTPDAATYETALKAFDAAASEGSRRVLAGPEPTPDGLGDLNAWATRQGDAIAALQKADRQVPGADQSSKLMKRLSERAQALRARMGCTEVSNGVDDLGPIPASGPCVPSASSAQNGASPLAGSRQSARTPGAAPSGTATTSPSGQPTTDQQGNILDPLAGGNASSSTTTSPSATQTSSQNSTSTDGKQSGSDGSGGGSILPPINIPPLLPGLPPITLG
jgi:hypothetical protein